MNLNEYFVPRPSKYDFCNWELFYTETLCRHPEFSSCALVSDRIQLFKSLVTSSVIDHLGALVKPHSRYDTKNGWDHWVENVMDALRDRDSTIGPASTVHGWVRRTEAGEVSFVDFWFGLDALVGSGQISSAEQRRLFWATLSYDVRREAMKRCWNLGPFNSVWKLPPDSVEVREAEQKLAGKMWKIKLEDIIWQKTQAVLLKATSVMLAYSVITLLIWGLNGITVYFLALLGLIFVFMPTYGPVSVYFDCRKLSTLKKRRG